VVLPDHMHCIWTLPPGDNDVSTRWRDIKSRFARMLPAVRPVSRAWHEKVNADYGNADSGSGSYAMIAITRFTWITYTSIR
jgi:REP element-mobilizing transposase RayT